MGKYVGYHRLGQKGQNKQDMRDMQGEKYAGNKKQGKYAIKYAEGLAQIYMGHNMQKFYQKYMTKYSKTCTK